MAERSPGCAHLFDRLPSADTMRVSFLALILALAPAALAGQEILLPEPPPATQCDSGSPCIARRGAFRLAPLPGAAAYDFNHLLAGAAPGLYVRRTSGELGAATRLIVRGLSHLLLPDAPLVVVDGLPVASEPSALGGLPTLTGISVVGELDPEQVERIELLPGPAAAARYGPSAAGGVLEVTTRRPGRSGWHGAAFSTLGVNDDTGRYPANFQRPGLTPGGAFTLCPLLVEAQGRCRPLSDSLLSFNPLEQASPFREGALWRAGARVEGGSARAGLLLHAARGVEHGPLRDNAAARTDLGGRLVLRPREGLEIALSATHLRRDLDQSQAAAISGTLLSGLLGLAQDDSLRGYLVPVLPFGPQLVASGTATRRSLTAAELRWNAAPWLRVAARYGADHARRDLLQRGITQQGRGFVDSVATRQQLSTATLELSAPVELRPGLVWRSGVGGERRGERVGARDIFRSVVPADSGLQRSAVRRRVLGAWLSQRVEWRGVVELDGVYRRDWPDEGALTSAGAGVSWSLGDERWLQRLAWMDGLVLRASWGSVQNAPGAALGVDALAGFPLVVCPALAGCDAASLQPERTRELELGADLRVLRVLGLRLTHYRRTTDDLLARSRIVSGPVVRNVGAVRNRGVEVALRLDSLATGPAWWELEVLGASNHNRVTRLDAVATLVGASQRVSEGFALGGYWGRPLERAGDADGDGVVELGELAFGDSARFLGPAAPERMLAAAARLHLGRLLTVGGRVEHQGAYRLYDRTGVLRCVTFVVCREVNDPATPIEQQVGAVASLMGVPDAYITDAGFTRLREATLTLAAPARWLRGLHGVAVELSVSGNNLATWTRYRGLDPEVNTLGTLDPSAQELGSLPLPRSWTTRVDVRW